MAAPTRPRIYLSPPHMSGEEETLVQAAFQSNWIAPTGPMVTKFEDALVEYTGFANVAALSSGTAALHIALRLSDVGSRDQVWVPTLTFIGGVAPIIYQGAEPVFFDVDPNTWLFDLDLLEEELTTARRRGLIPRAIITTDLYGYTVDVTRMQRLAAEYGFSWISDSAEALGSTSVGGRAGKGASFTILSFNGNKIITTSGGGALASEDRHAIDKVRFLSTQARDAAPHYEHSTYGYNYRMSNICAAIGVGQMNVLERRVAARRQIFRWYQEFLAGMPEISFPSEPVGQRPNRWLTTILVESDRLNRASREYIRLGLEAENVESRPVWKPMHLQPVFAGARRVGGSVAEAIFSNGLCLPSGSALGEGAVRDICEVVKALLMTNRISELERPA